MTRNLFLAVGLAVLTLLVPMTPASAARGLDRADLLTAKEVASSSSRTGWHRDAWDSSAFDCGSRALIRAGAVSVARVRWESDLDASGFELAVRHRDPATARAVYRSVVAGVRECAATVADRAARVTYDMPVAGPGSVRMIRLLIHAPDSGSDSHTFGILRRGSRVAVVTVGELGETIAVGPHRRLLRRAAERLAN